MVCHFSVWLTLVRLAEVVTCGGRPAFLDQIPGARKGPEGSGLAWTRRVSMSEQLQVKPGRQRPICRF